MEHSIELDINLLHLEYMLLDLDNYKYDKDIIKILNQLKSLVDKKLYSNMLEGDIESLSYILKYKIENKRC